MQGMCVRSRHGTDNVADPSVFALPPCRIRMLLWFTTCIGVIATAASAVLLTCGRSNALDIMGGLLQDICLLPCVGFQRPFLQFSCFVLQTLSICLLPLYYGHCWLCCVESASFDPEAATWCFCFIISNVRQHTGSREHICSFSLSSPHQFDWLCFAAIA